MEIFNQPLAQLKTDCLVIGIPEGRGELKGVAAEVDRLMGGALSEMIKRQEITGQREEAVVIHTLGKMGARRLIIIGLGEAQRLSQERLAEAYFRAAEQAMAVKAKQVTYTLFPGGHDVRTTARTMAESHFIAAYRFEGYRQNRDKAERHRIESASVLLAGYSEETVKEGIQIGEAYAAGTNLARDLVNTPGNKMTPGVLADHAAALARRYGMEIEVLSRSEMERLGMGALLAVSQGSKEPPRLAVIKYQGRDKWENVLGLVGKGVTFDTGGISIKPSAELDEMKMDMGGAASVLGVLDVAGRLRPAVNLLAVLPMTENMPSGSAYKPGDVLTTMSGKTVEVLNTDAEGRLILADAITYAQRLGAAEIIDLATLTGAVLVALGTIATGAMTNDERFLKELLEAAKQVGEKVWQLPSDEAYFKPIKGKIADLRNVGGRYAGAITAGLFIGAFIENGTPWIHLDIAGTAWKEEAYGGVEHGATGVMVRTLAQMIQNRAAQNP